MERFGWILAVITLCCAPWVTGCGADDDGGGKPVIVTGTAFAFALPGTPYGRMEGATISVLERPEISTTADDKGEFRLEGLLSGEEASFVIVLKGYPEAQTKTFTLPEAGIERLTFQVPADTLYKVLADVVGVTLDPELCQLVSTVTRVGKSLFDEGAHGEVGASVSLEPEVAPERGPIYFNDDVIPDKTQSLSSTDGGIVYTNIPPGEYVLKAHKVGVDFESVRVKCRAGVLVNASPPYGLQAL